MKPIKISDRKPKHDPSRIGDLAEHYAITWLWDNGYHVFKNCGCTGPIDIIALDPKGKVILIDVKSYNSVTRKCRFIRHRK
jgi:Holliday junction resolvase-like predicted endonuclease